MTSEEAPSLSLFGAPLDTGNLGVSALGVSTLAAIDRHLPGVTINVFDHGRGIRERRLRVADRDIRIMLHGGHISRRLYRSESLWTMLAASRTWPRANPHVRALAASRAILDISGGDSFTDLYGRKRLDLVTLPKRIARNLGRPLVLLPQTYGPFSDPRARSQAREILGSAHGAWARDEDSYAILQDVLGDLFNPDRHHQGVDVAFALPTTVVNERLGTVASWLAGDSPVIGINVSGLLFNDPAEARARFGLSIDYPRLMVDLVKRLLQDREQRVLLVPHVPGHGPESDTDAVRALAAQVDGHGRVAVLPSDLGPDEVKGAISRLDWFVGARMHATIAALSSQTPAAAIAYSDKFRGTFGHCGLDHRVFDARRMQQADLLEALLEARRGGESDRRILSRTVPHVTLRAAEQFKDLLATLPASEGGTPG